LASKWTNGSKVDRHATNIRSTEKELTGDEKRREDISPAVGRRHSPDPRWMTEDGADDGEY
jgi:hypothetical protein